MAKRIGQMTWKEVQKEMIIAGDAEKVTEVGQKIWELLCDELNLKNIPTIDNAEFALLRVIAELKTQRRIQNRRQHPETDFKSK